MSKQEARLDELLAERARRLAEAAARTEQHELRHQVALVRVGSQRLGVPAEFIREIVPLKGLVRVPSQPPLLQGLTQLRGELMGVVDTAALLEITDAEQSSFLVVLDAAPGTLALGVDVVDGFRAIHADEVAQGLAGTAGPVITVTRDFVAVLDVPLIFQADGIKAGQPAAAGPQ
jgi:chemotaxis signal transduction protein